MKDGVMNDTVTAILHHALERIGGQERQGQTLMQAEVADALDNQRSLIVQAGTGTGKSLAYLIPAMVWAYDNDTTVVISTATRALQHQLIDQDIPLALDACEEVTGNRPRVALLQGWRNYVCRYKAGARADTPELFDEDDDDISDYASARGRDIVRIRKWIETTETGERDDLVPGVDDRTWNLVTVPTQECLGSECAFADECFARVAKQKAQQAHIVVTNHSMVAIEAALPVTILPDFDALIVDEAHELVENVRKQGACTVSEESINRIARKIHKGTGANVEGLEKVSHDIGTLMRTYDAQLLDDIPGDILGAMITVHSEVKNLAATLSQMRKDMDLDDEAMMEFRSAQMSLTNLADTIEQVQKSTNTTHAMWIEEKHDGEKSLHVAPLAVASTIADELLSSRASVLTSATLRVGSSFDSFAHEVGASAVDVKAIDVGSPFDYKKQGILYCPSSNPPPPRSGISSESLDEIKSLVDASDGGALCLFSSFKALSAAAEHLRSFDDGRSYYVQGEEQLATLTQAFSADPHAVLLGTKSLWQGVDFPGLGCRLVIIDRIPFTPPDDPIVKARENRAKADGKNSFMEVTIPTAAITLAQGVGRLIRRHDDRGVVAILDPRLMTKGYSRVLLNTLPQMWQCSDQATVCQALKRLNKSVSDHGKKAQK